MRCWILLCSIVLLAGCEPAAQPSYQPTLSTSAAQQMPTYRVGVHPLHNPQRLLELYGPIVDHINAAMPEVQFVLEASRNYDAYETKLYAGYFDFALPNPYQTVMAQRRGYRVIAKMGNDSDFRGLILLRKDSPIKELADLRGKTIAYPAPTALAGTMMPQYYLHQHGLNVLQDTRSLYVGSQESAMMNVLRGHTAAAATWPVPWKSFQLEHPALAQQLVVRWQTEPLLNNSWMVRNDVPEAVVKSFTHLLLELDRSPAGHGLLQRLPIAAFEAANDATYAPVKDFLDRFAREVRPLEH